MRDLRAGCVVFLRADCFHETAFAHSLPRRVTDMAQMSLEGGTIARLFLRLQ
jgi:hypothetical protein